MGLKTYIILTIIFLLMMLSVFFFDLISMLRSIF